jgi:hypothetical protein
VANTISAFLERLTAAAGEFNKAKVGTLGALDAVYLDIRSEVARMGQTLRIYYPDITPFTDQAANDWTPEDTNPAYVDVPFGQRPGKAIIVRDFEQFQTSTDIIEQFIDPNFKRACEYANGAIFSLCTPTYFSAYGAIQTLPAEVDVGSARLAWSLLTRNKVPVQDDSNSTILYHPDVHANTLTDPAWSQENLVSAVIAQGTRLDAAQPGSDKVFPIQPVGGESVANQAFKFKRRFDQQAPVGTTLLAGTVTTVNGSQAIVGVGTAFKTAVAQPVSPPNVGNTAWLTFGTDTIAYPVQSVTDDTHLTLAMPYGGTGAAGATATRTTYTGVAMHRYAIVLAVRPLDLINDGHIHSQLMMIKGLPMRLMLSWQHLKSGWLMTLDYGMVAKVVRPDFGVLLNS